MTRRIVLAALLLLAAACGPKTLPPTVPGTPHFPDYIFPAPEASVAPTAAAGQREAWDMLQAGNLAAADRELGELLKQSPGDPAVLASLGYVALAKRDADRAVSRFNEALRTAPALAAALVGRGLALASENRSAEALASFEAAHAADPALDLGARIDALRFRAVEEIVSRARADAASGRLDEARAEYQNALSVSADSALLLREMAAVERQEDDRAAARQHLERAIQLDSGDRASRLQLADLLEEQGDAAGAITLLEAAQAIERTTDVEARLATLRERADLAKLPDEYRDIESAPAVTRAQVAALLGVRLPALLRAAPRRGPVLVTDIAGSWASPWIASVLDAGVMEPFANHTFQPQATLRRSDFAGIVSRVLGLASTVDPSRGRNWPHDRVTFTDVAEGHPAFDAVSRAVGARILTTSAQGAFEPTRPVTGAEAAEAIARLQRLVGTRAAERKP